MPWGASVSSYVGKEERRTGFEPATPSLGSWPGALERTHGILAPPLATRRDRSRGLPETPSGTFGSTFDERVYLRGAPVPLGPIGSGGTASHRPGPGSLLTSR